MRHISNIPISYLAISLLLAFAALIFGADIAHAQANGTIGSFSCSGGSASGNLYDSGESCPTTLNMGNVFSFLICNMEQLSSNLMGHMYCGIIHSLEPAVWTAATLAIILFGASFTLGLTPARGQDFLLFALKIGMVTGFATNADLLIGIGYKFFMVSIKDGVSIILSGIGGDITNGSDLFKTLDKFWATLLHFATDSVGATATADRCKNAVFAVLATMAVAFPLLSYLGLVLLARIVMTFLRAVFGYIYAVVGITFLMTLAPFFVSFYLFKETRGFFDKWLGYLASFTLQAIMMFTGIALVLMIPVKTLTSSLSDIIMYNEQTAETTSLRFPLKNCTVCDFKIVDKDNPSVELTDKSANFISNGQMVCRDTPPKPIGVLFAMAPKPDSPSTSSSSQLSALLLLAGNGILALIVLAVVVERLLANLPSLAHRIASGLGASYAPETGSMAVPGQALAHDFGAGFRKGFGPAQGSSSDGLSSAMRGVRDGFSAMATGKTRAGAQVTDEMGNAVPGAANRYPWLGIRR